MADVTNKPPPFRGFERPRQNYFKMPNHWTDLTSEMGSIAELKVVEYVLKHTWGYQEFGIAKRISLTEFMFGRRRIDGSRMDKGTGLSKPSVIAGVKSAVERGLLIEETDNSDLGRVKKFYRLRMREEDEENGENAQDGDEGSDDDGVSPLEDKIEEEAPVKDLNAGVKNLYRGVKKVDRGGKESLPRTEKETTERNKQERQQINNNSKGDQIPANPVVVALLTGQGIAPNSAEKLARTFEEDSIRNKVAYLEFLQDTRPNEVQKPAAWLRSAIENDYAAPDGFVSEVQRRQLAEEEKRRQKTAAEDAKKREAQRQKAEKQREKKLDALRKQYGTTAADRVLWNTVLDEIKASGDTELGTLLADALILQTNGSTLVVGIESQSHAQQLTHPRVQTLIKKSIKRALRQDFDAQFVTLQLA